MNTRLSSEASLSEVHQSVDTTNIAKPKWKRMLSFFGPAYLVSVGYMDPGNWATDLQGGSQFGYKLIWVLLMSNLMALLLQRLVTLLVVVCLRIIITVWLCAYAGIMLVTGGRHIPSACIRTTHSLGLIGVLRFIDIIAPLSPRNI